MSMISMLPPVGDDADEGRNGKPMKDRRPVALGLSVFMTKLT